MLRYFLVLTILMSMTTGCNNAIGSQAQSVEINERTWEEDKMFLQGLDGEKYCQKSWDILWYWAKKENMEARHSLLFLMAPPPDMLPMQIPGNHGDTISRLKDVLVMSIHSIDYEGNESRRKYFVDLTISMFKQFQLDQILSGKKYLKCVQEDKSSNCAEVAVEENIVPKFSDFAADIDILVENGRTANCTYR